MCRYIAWLLVFAACFALSPPLRADQRTVSVLREQIEAHSALLDSHTRRLYYEIREHAAGDDDQAQLLSDARELWRAARRLNDRASDGEPAHRLEREARKVEDAFHTVEKRYGELREFSGGAPPVRKRLARIDSLVHQAHDGVHALANQQAARPVPTPQPNYGYRTVEPLPRLQEAERRAADYVDPPAVRVGPDGFYFDGRRFTIPLGR